MSARVTRYGFWATLLIVALRMAIGWHFFSAGAAKINNAGFRSSYFLDQAVGPFAKYFRELSPDPYGSQGLLMEDRRAAADSLAKTLLDRVGASDERQEAVDTIKQEYLKQLKYYEDANGEDIEQHLNEVERYFKAEADSNVNDVPFGKAWLQQKRAELKSAARPWISELTGFEKEYQLELTSALGIDPKTVPAVADPTEKGFVDHSVSWVTLIVGACLMLGFLTPVAALVGAGFLLTVMMTQPFWVAGANLDYAPYQIVEFIGLLFLAVVGAGQFAGLDFLFKLFGRRRKVSDWE